MRDSFSSFHPFVNFLYFASVLLCGMVFTHPVFQAIALVSAVLYSVTLRGNKAAKFSMLYMIPLIVLTAALNPVFNHAGVTILFYMRDGNPVTLESILYGISAACMLATVVLWCACYSAVMTSDKFIYLFGKIWPSLSLILSMALRFVPRYLTQLKAISHAQKCIGRDVAQGNMAARARNGIRILSIMTTWALENAIETADSMKSRGYGLPGRTSFAIFRFDSRDKIVFLIIIGLLLIVGAGAWMGYNTIRYFPSIRLRSVSPFGAVVYAAYCFLCMMPVVIQLVEVIKWKFIVSRT